MWISEETAIISLYNINWPVFITETHCVYCAVRTQCLYTIRLDPNIAGYSRFSWQSTHHVHTVQTGPAGSISWPRKVKQVYRHYKRKQLARNSHYNVYSYKGAQFTAPKSRITNHFPPNRAVPFKSVTIGETADKEGILPTALIEVSTPLAIILFQASWNVRAHAQKPDFVFRAKRTSPFKSARWGRQFSRLLAAEVCASAVVMLDTLCSEVVWRVLATHSIRQFPLHFPSPASPCAITFQLESNTCHWFCIYSVSWMVIVGSLFWGG